MNHRGRDLFGDLSARLRVAILRLPTVENLRWPQKVSMDQPQDFTIVVEKDVEGRSMEVKRTEKK